MTFGLPKSLFEQFHVNVKCKRVPKISLLTSYLSNMNWNLVSSKKYLIGRTNLISDIFIVLYLKHFTSSRNVPYFSQPHQTQKVIRQKGYWEINP